jgi:hypothetical protein
VLVTFGEFGVHGARIDIVVANDGVEALATSNLVILSSCQDTCWERR